MVEYMEALTLTEAENLKKTIRELFRQTCILQVKYDPVTLVPKDNPRYQMCTKHREFIQDYLSVIGCELRHESQEHIFWIAGEGVAAEKLSETTTLVLLLLKLIYRDKIMGEGLHATVTNLAEIREYGRNTNLITNKLSDMEWREILAVMKTHQILELPAAIKNLEDQTLVYIYGTINIYCSAVDINELIEKYRNVPEEGQAVDKEETYETGEEEDYPDAAE